MLRTKVLSSIKVIPAKYSGAVPLVLGVVLAGQKNEILAGAGMGMIADGGVSLVEGLMPGTIAGIGQTMGRYPTPYVPLPQPRVLQGPSVAGAGVPLEATAVIGGTNSLGRGFNTAVAGVSEMGNFMAANGF